MADFEATHRAAEAGWKAAQAAYAEAKAAADDAPTLRANCERPMELAERAEMATIEAE
jgi:hypothetical protein